MLECYRMKRDSIIQRFSNPHVRSNDITLIVLFVNSHVINYLKSRWNLTIVLVYPGLTSTVIMCLSSKVGRRKMYETRQFEKKNVNFLRQIGVKCSFFTINDLYNEIKYTNFFFPSKSTFLYYPRHRWFELIINLQSTINYKIIQVIWCCSVLLVWIQGTVNKLLFACGKICENSFIYTCIY